MFWSKPTKALTAVSETWESLEAYTLRKNIPFAPFVEQQTLAFPAPVCLSGGVVEAARAFHSHTKSAVLRIKNQRAYCALGHVLDAEHNVVYHPFMRFSQLPISRQHLPKKVKKLSGTIAYLSNTAADHYGHWLRLTLPMLRLYAQEGRLENIDYFYVGDVPIKPFMVQSFEMLGILPAKLTNYPCTSETILVATNRWEMQEGYRYLDIGSYEFVRQNFLNYLKAKELPRQELHNCCYAPRVYIGRGNVHWRKVVNEPAVLALMQKYNFECRVLDNLSVEEQFKICYFAKSIVAPHGSALTNLLFAQAGTKVLEIYPEAYNDHAAYTLAALSQCDYFYMRSETPEGQASVACEYQNMKIDIALLENNLQKII